MTTTYKLTPAALRIVRNVLQISQQQLADLVSVDHSHIARIESGERSLTPEICRRIELAIGWEDPALKNVIASIQIWKESHDGKSL